MQRGRSRQGRDPYFRLKVFNLLTACAILVLTLLHFLLPSMPDFTVKIIFALGIVMCALTGIMELAKDDKPVGYVCSILSGVFTVALIFSVVSGLWLK